MQRVAEDIRTRAKDREIAILGSGLFGRCMLELFFRMDIDICFFADEKYGLYRCVCGRNVYSKEFLDPDRHFVILSATNPRSAASMCSDLAARGFQKKDYFSFCENADRDLDFFGVSVGRRSNFITPFVYPYTEFLSVFPGRRLEKVGKFTYINPNSILGVDIHNTLSTRSDFYDIIPSLTDIPINKVDIGNDVWISANTFINASRVRNIGNGAIICAGAVVLEDVLPYTIVAGVPAKVKKYRYTEEQIRILQRVQWWNWDDDTMREHEACFSDINLFFQKFSAKELSI